MNRTQFIAAAVAIVLSPAVLAANTTVNNSTIAAAADAGSLPSVTVQSAGRFHDYTGVAGSMANADGPAYSLAAVHEYTGMAGESNPALVARVPVWNSALAHDYTAD